MRVLHFKFSSSENWDHLVRNCLSFSPVHIWSAPFLPPPPLRKEATTSANINQPLFFWHLFKPIRNRFWTFPLARAMDQLKYVHPSPQQNTTSYLYSGWRLRPKRLHCHRKTRDCKILHNMYNISLMICDQWNLIPLEIRLKEWLSARRIPPPE